MSRLAGKKFGTEHRSPSLSVGRRDRTTFDGNLFRFRSIGEKKVSVQIDANERNEAKDCASLDVVVVVVVGVVAAVGVAERSQKMVVGVPRASFEYIEGQANGKVFSSNLVPEILGTSWGIINIYKIIPARLFITALFYSTQKIK